MKPDIRPLRTRLAKSLYPRLGADEEMLDLGKGRVLPKGTPVVVVKDNGTRFRGTLHSVDMKDGVPFTATVWSGRAFRFCYVNEVQEATKKKRSSRRTAAYENPEPMDNPFCPGCGGVGFPLGFLGRRAHFRCEACDLDFSHDEGTTATRKIAVPVCPACETPLVNGRCDNLACAKFEHPFFEGVCPVCGERTQQGRCDNTFCAGFGRQYWRPEVKRATSSRKHAAGELDELGRLMQHQLNDLAENPQRERPATLPCSYCGAEADYDQTYASFPSSYANYVCPACHKETHYKPGTTRADIEGPKVDAGQQSMLGSRKTASYDPDESVSYDLLLECGTTKLQRSLSVELGYWTGATDAFSPVEDVHDALAEMMAEAFDQSKKYAPSNKQMGGQSVWQVNISVGYEGLKAPVETIIPPWKPVDDFDSAPWYVNNRPYPILGEELLSELGELVEKRGIPVFDETQQDF